MKRKRKVGDILIDKKFFGLITEWRVIEKISSHYERSALFSNFEHAILFSKLCQMDAKRDKKRK